MEILTDPSFWQVLLIVVLSWLVFVAGLFAGLVVTGITSAVIAIRIAYGVFFITIPVYLTMFSPYQGYFEGAGKWYLIICVVVLIALLVFAAPHRK